MISNREGREWLLKQLYDKGIKYIVYLGDIFGYVGVEKKPEQQEDGKVYVWALGTTSWSKSNAHVSYIPVIDARLGESDEP